MPRLSDQGGGAILLKGTSVPGNRIDRFATKLSGGL